MKNIIVYLNPKKDFEQENARYVQIQIENGLNYWKPEDLILVTNFPYQYQGIKALVVPDNLICKFDAKACKINVIIHLLENKILTEPGWYHDLEAFQISPINLDLDRDLGLTDYGWSSKWNTGSFFFKPSALDIFQWLRDEIYKRKANEEPVLWILYKNNFKNIQSRCQRLNITYNLGKRHVEHNLSRADKPVRVVHFHPYRENLFEKFKPLLPDNLIKLIDEKSFDLH